MIWPIAFLRPFAHCQELHVALDRVIASSVTRPAVSHQSFGHHANSCRLSASHQRLSLEENETLSFLHSVLLRTIIYYWARSAGF